MTDPSTHPSTEAVGEVRRRSVAIDPPTPTLADRAEERRREVGETWHDPATYTHTSAGAPWVVDRDGPLARSLRTDGWLDPAAAEKLRSDLSAMTSDRDWLRGELDKAAAEIAELRALILEFIDDGVCEYDHHRYCQTHSLHSEPCSHARAKALFLDDDKED